MRTTFALSRATSVPAPIATPTVASIRAGGVVDAISHHDDVVPSLRELADEFQLFLRQKVSSDFIDAQLSADVVSHSLGVPCEKNGLQSHGFEIRYRLYRFRPKRIGDDESSEELAFFRHENLRIRLAKCFGRNCNAVSLKKEPIAHDDFLAETNRNDSSSGRVIEFVGLFSSDSQI
jgi:hypothetical protein